MLFKKLHQKHMRHIILDLINSYENQRKACQEELRKMDQVGSVYTPEFLEILNVNSIEELKVEYEEYIRTFEKRINQLHEELAQY